ncbi:MAG: pilus assembly protein TadG-related protein [Acidimicrobiales bacterium]
MTPAAPRRSAEDSGRGSVTVFVLLLTLCLVALLGLVANGGAVLSAREAALAEAEQAARAGAAVLMPGTVHDGGIATGGSQASNAAEQYMEVNGHPGTATASGIEVTAHVSPFAVSTPLLGLVGVDSIEVSATAEAEAVDG